MRTGSITAFYSLLMEGDDQQDPLVDAVRALLDGHVILERRLAVAESLPSDFDSRQPEPVDAGGFSPDHLEKVQRLRRLLASYAASEDLLRVGAYQKNADSVLDQAIAVMPALMPFLQQKKDERPLLPETIARFMGLPG